MEKKSRTKSAKIVSIAKKIWRRTPDVVRNTKGSAIIVSMAAGLLAAATMDECGKSAVQDMAKDMAHKLNYTWDPFDGMLA